MEFINLSNVRLSLDDNRIVLSLPQAALAQSLQNADSEHASSPDARNAFRVLVRDWMDVEAQLLNGQESHAIRLKNVSLGGFEMQQPASELRLPTNRSMVLHICTGDRSIELHCRPVRFESDTIAFRFTANSEGQFVSPQVLEQIVVELQRQWVSRNGYACQFNNEE